MTDEKRKRSRHSETAKFSADNPSQQAAEAVNPNQPAETQPLEQKEEIITTLQQDLEVAQSQCKEYFEGWQRERADFMNYKKRVERDQVQLNQVIAANVIKKFLVVLDDMERAVRNRPANVEQQEWWSGMELILRKLQSILEAEGVQPLASAQEAFDPNLHEAISHEDHGQVQSGLIIEVVQQGYRIGERIIRPALVRVAR
ncbi:MAG: nucleotide exchange factor GrpE [Chloroflexota bacterium]|jgi:molecular chaperone GrpE